MERMALSGLCATCHVETPKYRCPRCETQTCSLACFKRHKQRASCNGVRDPTTFVKKSQWATPAGVDHDYNYLRSVERSIDGANQEAETRGINIDNPSARGAAKARMAGTTLEKYLSSNRITVDRAPLGMSRQKCNQTRSSKKGNVIWTVEWIGNDGARYISNDCPAATSIAELFRLSEPYLTKTLSDQPASKKRKRGHVEVVVPALEGDPNPDAITKESNVGGGKASNPEDSDMPLKQGTEGESNEAIKLEVHNMTAVPLPGRIDSDDSCSSPRIITEAEPTSSTADKQNDSVLSSGRDREQPQSTFYFYLLRPATTRKACVLIPLDSQITLTDALRDRVIQEYPTIHVLRHSPANLPSTFVLEAAYLRSLPLQRPAESTAIGVMKSASISQNEPQELDADGILKMLRRDVTT